MTVIFRRRADVTDPPDRLLWLGPDNLPRDLEALEAAGWTPKLELVDPATNEVNGSPKTTGIVGGDGTGATNLAIDWTAAEMGSRVGATRWRGRITYTLGAEKIEFVLDDNDTLPVWIFDPVPVTP